ncbi:MAG: hypothetical protein EOO02_12390 [Chitinophagaceae bacterium]|nr:MAG: hypothetical protein EOO02_12390 [Chitinophagaceae bacterium]
MAKVLLLLILQGLLLTVVKAQSFNFDDLVVLSSLSPKRFDNYMHEKGYVSGGKQMQDNAMAFTFFEKKKKQTPEDSIIENRSVGLYKQDESFCFAFSTTCRKEFEDGLERLRTNNFLQAEPEDSNAVAPLFFQKGNLTVDVSTQVDSDTSLLYTFLLKKRLLPNSVQFAEDLLGFDSHEYLVSYFGEANVKKDVYYFSEKKIKKCSVLFGNSNQQVVFVWEDEKNLCKLSYILIAGILPTETGIPFNDNIGRNKWAFKSGIYSGMSIRDLLRLNGYDFKFYGLNSEFSMMVEPVISGNIDFKKTGIMLTSLDGKGPAVLQTEKVSAEQVVEHRIALHVFYIMLTP